MFTKYQKARKIRPDEKIDKKIFELVGGVPFYLMALAQAWKVGNKIVIQDKIVREYLRIEASELE